MRRHAWVLLAYIVLSLILTWPLVVQFGSHVPGDGIDDPALAWNLWWVKHTLVDQPQNPFRGDWQFWPIGINLAFYTLTVLNGLLSVPLQGVFGLIPAYNILLLSSFVLGGFGAYLLCLEFLRASRVPSSPRPGISASAFLGGALYAFASAKLFYAALGQGNIASSQWLPFAALYMIRAARPTGKARDAALAGLFLVLQAYAELTYASFLALFAALVVGWRMLRIAYGVLRTPAASALSSHSARDDLSSTQYVMRSTQYAFPLLARFALIALLLALGLAPFLANMLPDLRAEGDFFTSGGGFADIFSADLAGYLVPTQLHPLLGGVVRGWAEHVAARADGSYFAVDKGQQIYVGYIALALAAVGVWWGRRRGATSFWLASTLVFFLLTLGPSLRVAGHDTGLPLPFQIIEQLPFFKGNRYPSRYSVMLLLSLAPLVALGSYRLAAWANGRWPLAHSRWLLGSSIPLVPLIPLIPLCFLLFEHLSAPLPTFDLRVPAIYDRVAAAPGDFALLELPLGWRNGARVAGKKDIVIMQQLWYQTAHGKRVLGGNTSRNPEYKFQYFSEDPTLAWLIAAINAADLPQHTALRQQLAERPVAQADRDRARAWAAFVNIRYVMIHRDKLPPTAEALARDLLQLTLVAEDGALALYRVAEPLAIPQTFTPGSDQGRMILGEGWSPPAGAAGADGEPAAVYAQRREVRLLLPLGSEASTLLMQMRALAADQRVSLWVDGMQLGTQALGQARTWLTFTVPAAASRPPLSDVRLRFSQLSPVAEWGARGQQPGPGALLVRSAGEEAGDFGHIYLAGVDVSPNRRGYNLAAINAETGALLATANFDTHADPDASARLAAWVRAWPSDTLIAGAVRDEASALLGAEAVTALRGLGLTADLRGRFRWGHAFIGQAGADAGTAQEALDGIRPAQVTWGLGLTEPHLAAAFYRLLIVK